MKLYWIKTAPVDQPAPLNLGVGVTARSEWDARRLVEAAFPNAPIESVSIVDDLSTLDQDHVLTNMGNIFARGIWFPLGYEYAAGSVL